MNLITNPVYSNVPGNFYHTLKQSSENNENITHATIQLTNNQSIIVVTLMVIFIIFISYIMYKNLQ